MPTDAGMDKISGTTIPILCMHSAQASCPCACPEIVGVMIHTRGEKQVATQVGIFRAGNDSLDL
jgi:hypothetical protein